MSEEESKEITIGEDFGSPITISSQGNHDRIQRTANTFGTIKKTTIIVEYGSKELRGNMDDGFKVTVGKPDYTKVESALSQIIFDTDQEYINGVIKQCIDEFPSIMSLPEPNKTHHPQETNQQRIRAKELMNMASVILESRRTESLYGKIYQGSNYWFLMNRIDNADLVQDILNPIDAMLVANGKDFDPKLDKTDWKNISKYLHMVDRRTIHCTEIALTELFREVIKPFVKGEEPPEEQEQESSGDNDDTQDEPDNADLTPEEQLEMELSMAANHESVDKTMSMFPLPKEIKISTAPPMKIDITDRDMMLQVSEDVAQQQVDAIIDAISKTAEMPVDVDPQNIILQKIYTTRFPVIDNTLVLQLKTLFKRIKEKYTEKISEEGIDFDCDNFIQHKYNKTIPYFVDSVKKSGLSILILIDCSSSMGKGDNPTDKIAIARNICATLMKSLEELSDVDLTVLGYHEDYHKASEKHVCFIKQAMRPSDCGGFSGYGTTPTYFAMKYATELLNKKEGLNKFLIVLTDGQPSESVHQIPAINRLVTKSRFKGINTFGIYIGNDESKSAMESNPESWFAMKEMFRDNCVDCTTIEQAKMVLISQIKNKVIRHLSR